MAKYSADQQSVQYTSSDSDSNGSTESPLDLKIAKIEQQVADYLRQKLVEGSNFRLILLHVMATKSDYILN